jgi:hypothetical protein
MMSAIICIQENAEIDKLLYEALNLLNSKLFV